MQNPGAPANPYRGSSPAASVPYSSPYMNQGQLSPVAAGQGQFSQAQSLPLSPKLSASSAYLHVAGRNLSPSDQHLSSMRNPATSILHPSAVGNMSGMGNNSTSSPCPSTIGHMAAPNLPLSAMGSNSTPNLHPSAMRSLSSSSMPGSSLHSAINLDSTGMSAPGLPSPGGGGLGHHYTGSPSAVSAMGQTVSQYIMGAGAQPRLVCFPQGQFATAGQITPTQLAQFTPGSARLPVSMYRPPMPVTVAGQSIQQQHPKQMKVLPTGQRQTTAGYQARMNRPQLPPYQQMAGAHIGQPQVMGDQGAVSIAFRQPLLGSPVQAVGPSGFTALQLCNVRPAIEQHGKQSRPTTPIQPKPEGGAAGVLSLGQPRHIQSGQQQQAQFLTSPASLSPISPLSPRLVSQAGGVSSVNPLIPPQFLAPSGSSSMPPLSPQFVRPGSAPVSPIAVPLRPGVFQVTGNIGQPQLIPIATSGLQQIQPAMIFTGQSGNLLNTGALRPATSLPHSSVSPGVGGVPMTPYSAAAQSMTPVLLPMSSSHNDDIPDQPTDLSKKATAKRDGEGDEKMRETAGKGELLVQPVNAKGDASFHESCLNLQQTKEGASLSDQAVTQRPSDQADTHRPSDPTDLADTPSVVPGSVEEKEKAEKCATGERPESETADKYQTIDTGDYTEDGVPVVFDEPEFVWEDYLQETGATAVPPTAFRHVEFSLQSGFVKGMKLEVLNKSNPHTYWVASVVMTCGPLLRLRFDGYEEDSSADFWCDLTTSEIHPIGWCAQNGQNLQPPDEIKFKVSDWREFLMNSLTGARTAPSYLLDKMTGTTPIDQLKPGMRLELQDKADPRDVWLVKVIENVGGRLYLRLEGADSGEGDFWLFYLNHCLHPIGWAKTAGYRYKPPKALKEKHMDKKWDDVIQTAISETENMILPVDVFKDQSEIEPHKFEVGHKLEAINPMSRNQICPVTVIKVIDDKYFILEVDDLRGLDERKVIQFCCHSNSLGIFPVLWCQCKGIRLSHPKGWIRPDFNWNEYLSYCNAKAAPEKCFPSGYNNHEFERGMKLEAVNPDNANQICAATITKITGPLLWIHLDNSAKVVASHMELIDSFNLFPVGWCESNGYQLKPPRKTVLGKSHQKRPVLLPPEKSLSADDFRSRTYSHVKSGDNGGSWCPKIYFNHRCFSGPYLSKGRIAELPKCVGPGPILLVMKEVLTMLISVAYKSCRVLKELQMSGKPNPSMQQQTLKAKYKGKSYCAAVEICREEKQLEEFCRQVCIKLECCPYLFSPQFIEEECPENCQQLTKTKYNLNYGKKKKIGRPPGGHTNLENGARAPGKRGRRRKRYHLMQKKTHPSYDNRNKESYNPDSVMPGEQGVYSREKDQDLEQKKNGLKRKYTHHLPPPTDIKTRGAKLPKYSFERKTHKKILLSQTNTSSKSTRHRTHASSQQAVVPSGQLTLKKEGDLEVDKNPLYWTVNEVIRFIKTTDCSNLARIIREQQIDGQALLLLSLPAIQEYLELKLGPAVKLCHQIERVKVAFFHKYA